MEEERINIMKKRALLIALGLSIALVAGGCGKKDTEGLDNTATEDNDSKDSADSTEDNNTPDFTLPEKGEYDVSEYIKLGQYKGIEVKVEKLEVTEEDIEEAIQSDLQYFSKTEEVTGRPVEDGDIVNIDFEGFLDGEAFDGGSATGSDLTIGSNAFIDGFEEQLIGANIGEEVELNLSFPENYGKEELNGQPVVFKVVVNSIKVNVLPELNDDFVKEKFELETVEEYKESIREEIQAYYEEEMFAIKINNIMNTILDNSEIMGYPQTLIDYYIAEVNLSLEQNASLYGVDKETLLAAYNITQEDFDADAKIYAETMAKQEITLKAIIESENMDLSEEEFNEKVSQLALESGFSSSEELLKVAGEEEVKEILLYKKVMEFIAEEAIEL